MAARKSRALNEKHGPEIEADYRAGRSSRAMASCFEVSDWTILAVLRLRGVPRRTPTQIRALQHGLEGVPDADGLRAIYWGADLPSIAALARRFGMSDSSMGKRLRKSGTAVRSLSNQRKIDIAMGRYEAGVEFTAADRAKAHLAAVSSGGFARWQAAGQTRRARRNNAGSRFLQRTRHAVPCAWCGASLERTPSQIAKWPSNTCSLSHSSRIANHRRWHPHDPRPLIIERLWEAVGTSQNLKELLRAGEPIGATNTEYVAVVLVWVEQLKRHLEAHPKVTARDMTLKLTPEAERLKALVAWLADGD